MAAGSAAERAEAGGKRAARFRGRAVVLTFSMQACSADGGKVQVLFADSHMPALWIGHVT